MTSKSIVTHFCCPTANGNVLVGSLDMLIEILLKNSDLEEISNQMELLLKNL